MKTGFNDRSDMKAIKVCIIDDHSVVRMGLKYMISYIPDVECVGEASGGEGAAAFVCGPAAVGVVTSRA